VSDRLRGEIASGRTRQNTTSFPVGSGFISTYYKLSPPVAELNDCSQVATVLWLVKHAGRYLFTIKRTLIQRGWTFEKHRPTRFYPPSFASDR